MGAQRFHCGKVPRLATLPGHGFTDKPKITYNLPNFSKHLLDFMDAAGVKKAHLAGESQGGQISVLTASEHPERVNRLALIVGGLSNEHGHGGTAGRANREATGTPQGNDPQAHGMVVSRSKSIT
jgi:pimeloyl-ACP methyl ester carboxylesterase